VGFFLVHATDDNLPPARFGAEALVPSRAPTTTTSPASPRARAPEGLSATDGDLVARAAAKGGDRAAEEALYRRHVRYVAGMIGRLLGDRTEAEDCVQETFAIALERIGTLRDGDAVRAWIAQIGVSQVRRRFRKRKLLRVFGLDRGADDATLEAFAWQGASPETHAELAKLWRALASLPTEQRLAWSLRHVEGNALDVVAVACGCSLATAKRRIAAADAHVRAHASLELSP
jgi:RNA polymerase sigma-70 factor (ECF subfamily)